MRVVLGVCSALYVLFSFGPGGLAGTVVAAGTTIRVPAGGNLQAALNAAQPGDVILLQAGATYSGNYILPAKSGSTMITVQTDIAQKGSLAPGVRLSPAAAGGLAKIKSPNTIAALRTNAGAHHWRLQLLQFGPTKDGYGEIIRLGDGGAAQNSLSLVPYSLVLDRVYISGDPLRGQKRGIALNARDVTITNSTIRDIKTVGQDTQAIGGWNGPGPYLIENNYIEAAGENVMFGGSDPAIPGLIPGGITLRGNYLTKPLGWRDPIVPTPGHVTATVGTGGGLPATAYTYQVVARRPSGQGSVAQSLPSAPAAVSLPATGQVKLTWTPVPSATEYRVYRNMFGIVEYWTVTQPSFTDAGVDGLRGTLPTKGTVWSVKNLFELKNARDLVIEQNVFENSWLESQVGFAIQLTVRSGGACTWCTIQNLEFRNNVVRHAGAGINILGLDEPERPTVRAANLYIHDNLFYDINTRWGGAGLFLQIGGAPADVVVDHNTIDHNGGLLISAYGGTETARQQIPAFTYTNNLSRHGTYGVMGPGLAFGMGTITTYFPNVNFRRNLLSGGDAKNYPADNFFQPDFSKIFTSIPDADYRLLPGSPFHLAGTDNRDLGADMGAILPLIAEVPSAAPPPPQGLRIQPR
ncbi:MAG TPA: right-handed parallel beta-helix repeat-containing protein [Vicinamibacterales bacterium]|jgi:hypothetical protein